MSATEVPDLRLETMPISNVEWVAPASLHANGYNPNKVPKPELRLLETSILEDGWTQPIVRRASGEIVDGFHRWTVAQKSKEVAAMTGGLVPVVTLRDVPIEHQMMSTIRHNRARGNHHVLKMADIVAAIIDGGVDADDLKTLLGMDDEEVRRLHERGDMRLRHGDGDLGKGFTYSDQESGDEVGTVVDDETEAGTRF